LLFPANMSTHNKHHHHKQHHERFPHHAKHQESHHHHHHHKHSKNGPARGCVYNAGHDHLFHEALPHWTYDEQQPNGPNNWGKLCPDYALSDNGKQQSPIDLKPAANEPKENLELHYAHAPATILNNGHTISVTWNSGFIQRGEKNYFLVQFHFHGPSEHTVEGTQYPLEMHLVHKSEDNHLAVVGVFLKEGEENPFLAELMEHIPEKEAEEGETGKMIQDLDPEPLKLSTSSYFTYDGSLTTPPCSEGVLWLVIKEHQTASEAQIKKITGAIGKKNARPVQPLNERVIDLSTK